MKKKYYCKDCKKELSDYRVVRCNPCNIKIRKVVRNLCLNCKKICNKPHSIYCSGKCHKELKSLNLVNSGKMGNVSLRRYLLRTVGNKCSICNLTEWNGSIIPLVMDHKDGNPENNNLINVRLICPNCDALLPTYKGKNRGNGRWSRRLRYRQGKSY